MIDDILRAKRAGERLDDAAIHQFVAGVLDGSVSRPQAAAWLAFAFVRGLDDAESIALTRAMTDTGDKLSWPGIDGPFIDKHSTGGVGDKVSLVLAPLWAELGMKVPMISGRGLGHTGGTLDKLEAIPGYRTDLDGEALRGALRDVGCFINGQTATLAPADRILYALRNETQTVECIPLIVASILSKKLAEGLDRLVLDVKVGTGAFMKTEADARQLAEALVRVGNGAGVETSAYLTDMQQPLGQACGNALEVRESIACLQGGGPEDLRALTVTLAGHPDAAAVLASGRAYERFERMVAAHGGRLGALEASEAGVQVEEIRATRAGVLERCDAWDIGRAAFVAGAGRLRAEDAVHPGVGVTVLRKVGDKVELGQPLAYLHHVGRGLEHARAQLAAAFVVADTATPRVMLRGVVG
ncbi:MAG: thymidine phosphorylase [Pseudomonadota bacterium]|nr:thymidine phosphorylase [Pseudomonadota bacterium]